MTKRKKLILILSLTAAVILCVFAVLLFAKNNAPNDRSEAVFVCKVTEGEQIMGDNVRIPIASADSNAGNGTPLCREVRYKAYVQKDRIKETGEM
ncbi:MAG: hypothetical protein IJO48_07445 [Clostridia bacterium]|nr:hypothetical protein [Clostridia bacterium]